MKKLKKAFIGIAEKVTRREVERNNSDWPWCLGIIHQPKRPEKWKRNNEPMNKGD